MERCKYIQWCDAWWVRYACGACESESLKKFNNEIKAQRCRLAWQSGVFTKIFHRGEKRASAERDKSSGVYTKLSERAVGAVYSYYGVFFYSSVCACACVSRKFSGSLIRVCVHLLWMLKNNAFIKLYSIVCVFTVCI